MNMLVKRRITMRAIVRLSNGEGGFDSEYDANGWNNGNDTSYLI